MWLCDFSYCFLLWLRRKLELCLLIGLREIRMQIEQQHSSLESYCWRSLPDIQRTSNNQILEAALQFKEVNLGNFLIVICICILGLNFIITGLLLICATNIYVLELQLMWETGVALFEICKSLQNPVFTSRLPLGIERLFRHNQVPHCLPLINVFAD